MSKLAITAANVSTALNPDPALRLVFGGVILSPFSQVPMQAPGGSGCLPPRDPLD